MTNARPCSPNYCWAQAGYTIKRSKGKIGNTLRAIYDAEGNQILFNAGYEGEMDEIKKRGLLTG